MHCDECGLVWDRDDDDPPVCKLFISESAEIPVEVYNKLDFVFATGEKDSLKAGVGDRRYIVIDSKEKLKQAQKYLNDMREAIKG